MNRVAVCGASGLVGSAAVRAFAAAGWEVVALARRAPLPEGLPAGVRLVAADLDDASATRDALRGLGPVTHVVHAAAAEAPGLRAGWTDDAVMQRNLRMLQAFLEPLLETGTVEHVSLLQGTKAYGLHHPSVGWDGVRNPLRERDPRVEHPNWYFLQEDWLRGQPGAPPLTVLRPAVVVGTALGTGMNLVPVLGVHGALLRAQGRPLDFPGRAVSWQLKEFVDADLVGAALVWAATSPAAAGGTFNLTNGDVLRWPDVWGALAAALGMEPGEHRPCVLTEELPAQDARWAELVDRHGLRAPRRVVDVVGANSLAYADLLLAGGEPAIGPVLSSTVAVREAGFAACRDSEDVLVGHLRRLQELRVLPPP